MIRTTLNVQAGGQSVFRSISTDEAVNVVAALAADPANTLELEQALERFWDRSRAVNFLAPTQPGTDLTRAKGVLFIDLTSRVVAGNGEELQLEPVARAPCDKAKTGQPRMLPYSLADDWLFLNDVPRAQDEARERRSQGDEPMDGRTVLYERVAEYIVQEIAVTRSQLAELTSAQRTDLVRDVHARWLMTPREDLGGRSPRDWMLDERHEHIGRDVGNQVECWSICGEAVALRRESHAFQRGGVGAHEFVIYYRLVRKLVHTWLERLKNTRGGRPTMNWALNDLGQIQQEWLHTPDEELEGRTPAAVIDHERRRLPEVAEHDADHPDDPDCPICQLMGQQQFGPAFWFLDGSDLDPEFAFSLYRDYDDWKSLQY